MNEDFQDISNVSTRYSEGDAVTHISLPILDDDLLTRPDSDEVTVDYATDNPFYKNQSPRFVLVSEKDDDPAGNGLRTILVPTHSDGEHEGQKEIGGILFNAEGAEIKIAQASSFIRATQ